MGSYSSPSVVLSYYKTIQDNTNIDGDIIVGPFVNADFTLVIKRTALWNGQLDIELLKDDDTWGAIASFMGSALTYVLDGASINFYNADFLAFKYPFHVRVNGVDAPTVGVATCYLMTLPNPANPLF